MNPQIVVAAVVIGGVSIWHHHVFKAGDPGTVSDTGILVGSYIALGLFGLMEMVPGGGPLAGALAMLAMLTVLLRYLPDLLTTLVEYDPQGPPPVHRVGPGGNAN